jgi:hypothetical protein
LIANRLRFLVFRAIKDTIRVFQSMPSDIMKFARETLEI